MKEFSFNYIMTQSWLLLLHSYIYNEKSSLSQMKEIQPVSKIS
jgi:hypothetical protein